MQSSLTFLIFKKSFMVQNLHFLHLIAGKHAAMGRGEKLPWFFLPLCKIKAHLNTGGVGDSMECGACYFDI